MAIYMQFLAVYRRSVRASKWLDRRNGAELASISGRIFACGSLTLTLLFSSRWGVSWLLRGLLTCSAWIRHSETETLSVDLRQCLFWTSGIMYRDTWIAWSSQSQISNHPRQDSKNLQEHTMRCCRRTRRLSALLWMCLTEVGDYGQLSNTYSLSDCHGGSIEAVFEC